MDKVCETEIAENLAQSGFCEAEIEKIINYLKQNNSATACRIIGTHRKKLLDLIHENQKNIDNLDYFVYQLQNGKIDI